MRELQTPSTGASAPRSDARGARTPAPATTAPPRATSRIVSRVTLNLRARDDERLRRLTEGFDGDNNEALRSALALAEIFMNVTEHGGKVIVEDANGDQQVLQIVM